MYKELFDVGGKGSFVLGLMLKAGSWFGIVSVNDLTSTLTIISLTIGIVYFSMRIYHQRLETKKFKEERKKNQ